MAVVRLQHEAEYSDYVVPVCLPEKGPLEAGDFYKGLQGIVAGWGWIRDKPESGLGRGEYLTSTINRHRDEMSLDVREDDEM